MMLDRWVEEHATHGGAPEQALAACRRDLRAPVDPAAFLAAVEGVPASRNRLYFAPPKASLVLAQAHGQDKARTARGLAAHVPGRRPGSWRR